MRLLRGISTLALCLALTGCKKQMSTSTSIPFSDDFERSKLGDKYFVSGGQWKIRDGKVYTTGANNAPLFLLADLPDDLVVEVDIMSETSDVDSKIELMTDGRTHQSGYIFILGGWTNTLSVIARLDEHGNDRKVKKPTEVVGNVWYKWRIEKKGGDIRWYMDGKPYMQFSDSEPLQGPGHNRLAFSNWKNQIYYDNLKIWPYDQAPKLGTAAATSTTGAAP